MRIALTLWLTTALLAPVAACGADRSTEPTHCSTCHGSQLQGNVALQAPALAGMEPWYLDEQLRAYNQLQRGTAGFDRDPAGKEMQSVAREIVTPAQRAAALRHVASYSPTRPVRWLAAGNANNGAKLWDQHCASCHGAQAQGRAELHAPSLLSLNDWYLAATWAKYREGLRGAAVTGNAWALGMAEISRAMPTDFPIQDVIAHLYNLNNEPTKP